MAGTDLLREKSTARWWLVLIWFERKALLADKLNEQSKAMITTLEIKPELCFHQLISDESSLK